MRRPFFLVPLVLLAGVVRAQDAPQDDLGSLVEAERAFSAQSVERGMKDAFLTCLANDGVLFRPFPVNGRSAWAARENPPGTLIWEPSYAEVSAFGDLGVSTGPWEYRPPPGAKGDTAHGHFVSIWKRNAEGVWKVALDHGVSHAAPVEGGLGAVTFQPGPLHVLAHEGEAPSSGSGISIGGGVFGPGGGFGIGFGGGASAPVDVAAHEMHRMMSAERTLAFEMRGGGAGRAYPKVGAEDLRTYRDGARPTVGVTPAIEGTGAKPRALEFRSYGQKLAGSVDFGYSYGLALRTMKGANVPDTNAYVHVWRRDASGGWKLTLDLEVPIRR